MLAESKALLLLQGILPAILQVNVPMVLQVPPSAYNPPLYPKCSPPGAHQVCV